MRAHEMDKALDAVIAAVKEGLGLRATPRVVGGPPPSVLPGHVRPDYVLRSGRTTILVLVRRGATADDLARALLMARLLESDEHRPGKVATVLLAKVVPDDVRAAAEDAGVRLIDLDWDVEVPATPSRRRYSPSRLSNPTSWRVVMELLRSGPSSIRRVSRAAGSSYGWAHATVTRLIEMGVAERTSRGVAINDVHRLLNGVAWERPLMDLHVAGFKVAGDEVMGAARGVEASLGRRALAHAFTGPTAAGIYTGYAQRFDRIYLYLRREAMEGVRGALEDPSGTISLEVLAPDREVFDGLRERQGITLVDPAQALLDVTGLGYGYWELAERMVSHIEKAPDE